MAESENTKVNEEQAPQQPQEGVEKQKLGFFKFKIPLLIVLVVILAISTALVITKVTQSSAATKQEETKAAEKKAGTFITLDSFTVNLTGGANYLQIAIAFEIEAGKKELETEITDRKPQINDTIITIIGSKSIEDISGQQGREKLKVEIKKAVDSLLSYGKIERVYFTTFIMQ
ncbi:MAG TPA: flagellar basal body-associated FliL family protein [Candidatus Aquicultor sp.]|jgi:flagellar FliL protein